MLVLTGHKARGREIILTVPANAGPLTIEIAVADTNEHEKARVAIEAPRIVQIVRRDAVVKEPKPVWYDRNAMD